MMSKRNKLVDTKCADLAEYFLSRPHAATRAEDVKSLAEAIQEAIEEWFVLRDADSALEAWQQKATQ